MIFSYEVCDGQNYYSICWVMMMIHILWALTRCQDPEKRVRLFSEHWCCPCWAKRCEQCPKQRDHHNIWCVVGVFFFPLPCWSLTNPGKFVTSSICTGSKIWHVVIWLPNECHNSIYSNKVDTDDILPCNLWRSIRPPVCGCWVEWINCQVKGFQQSH